MRLRPGVCWAVALLGGVLGVALPAAAQTQGPVALYQPCPNGTPLPTSCECSVNGGAVVKTTPHKVPSTGKVHCWCSLAGLTGTVTLAGTPATDFGKPAPYTQTIDMSQYGIPAKLEGPITVLPALPQ